MTVVKFYETVIKIFTILKPDHSYPVRADLHSTLAIGLQTSNVSSGPDFAGIKKCYWYL